MAKPARELEGHVLLGELDSLGPHCAKRAAVAAVVFSYESTSVTEVLWWSHLNLLLWTGAEQTECQPSHTLDSPPHPSSETNKQRFAPASRHHRLLSVFTLALYKLRHHFLPSYWISPYHAVLEPLVPSTTLKMDDQGFEMFEPDYNGGINDADFLNFVEHQ